jgi:hypothetical protein
MSPNTCEFVVGNLLEIRVARGYRSVSDVDDMIAMIKRASSSRPAQEKFAIAADWRPVQIMSPDVAAHAKTMLSYVNALVTRSAILTLPENPMTNLQVVRLIREAENPLRRHFAAPDALQRWLGEALTPDETARLHVFLTS